MIRAEAEAQAAQRAEEEQSLRRQIAAVERRAAKLQEQVLKLREDRQKAHDALSTCATLLFLICHLL